MASASDINEDQFELLGKESTDAQRRVIRELLGLTADLPKTELLERLAEAQGHARAIEYDAFDQILDEEREKLIADKNEVIEAFESAGLELPHDLKDMLNEAPRYQGGRDGCGLSKASRFLAKWVHGKSYRVKIQVSDDYKAALGQIDPRGMKPESKLIFGLLADIHDVRPKNPGVTQLPAIEERVKIGTCSTAEAYFLDYLYDTGWPIVGDKKMNIVLNENGDALFIEKIGLGENHSAISLKEFYVNDVLIPPGSLVALKYSDEKIGPPTISHKGNIIQSSDLEGVEFLRFTTLVVKPEDRGRAFWSHLLFQIQNGMPGAARVSINDFINKARSETDPNMPDGVKRELMKIHSYLQSPTEAGLVNEETLTAEAKRYLEAKKQYLIQREREEVENAVKNAEQEREFERASRIYAKLKGDPVFEQIRIEEALEHIREYMEEHEDDSFNNTYKCEMTPDGYLLEKDGSKSYTRVTGYDVGRNSYSVVLARAVRVYERRYPNRIAELEMNV